MWPIIASFLAMSILTMDIGVILGMNRDITRRTALNFSLVSSIVFFILGLVGLLLGFLISNIADVKYLSPIVIAGVGAIVFSKALKSEKFSLIFFTNNVKDFILASVSVGLDVMLVSVGCFFLNPKSYIAVLLFLPVSAIFGVLGIILGLKTENVTQIKIFLFVSSVILIISAIFSFFL